MFIISYYASNSLMCILVLPEFVQVEAFGAEDRADGEAARTPAEVANQGGEFGGYASKAGPVEGVGKDGDGDDGLLVIGSSSGHQLARLIWLLI